MDGDRLDRIVSYRSQLFIGKVKKAHHLTLSGCNMTAKKVACGMESGCKFKLPIRVKQLMYSGVVPTIH